MTQTDAEIWIVREFPDAVAGMEGRFFDGTLKEAGIARKACRILYVCGERPPMGRLEEWVTASRVKAKKLGLIAVAGGLFVRQNVLDGTTTLLKEIENNKPKVVVAVGELALWALTNKKGIGDWRGSELYSTWDTPVLPIYSPASILRMYSWRNITVHDLKRVKRKMGEWNPPTFEFTIEPTFEEVRGFAQKIALCGLPFAADIETRRGRIVSCAIAVSATEAMCIPFEKMGGRYWQADEEEVVVDTLKRLMMGGACVLVGQNWNYDAQYFEKDFGFLPLAGFDTMVAQHVLYPGMPKNLSFLSSMYCEWHSYWKDDLSDWREPWADEGEMLQDWTYNCRDAVHTFEVMVAQRGALKHAGLEAQFEQRMGHAHDALVMSVRGVEVDQKLMDDMSFECDGVRVLNQAMLEKAAGFPLTGEKGGLSGVKLGKFFFETLGLKGGKRTAKGNASTDDEALSALAAKNPNVEKYVDAVLQHRSYTNLQATFLRAKLESDGRLRTNFNPAGPETFRLASSENVFGRGCNLQNVTGGKTHNGKEVLNLRRCIVPSPGYTIFEVDLERADLQVVVWEADDKELKAALKEGADIHRENAKALFGLQSIADVTDQQRSMAKTFVHGTNYGGGARTMAAHAKCTIHQSELLQRRWFEAHPGIKGWHDRVRARLLGNGLITNAFGFRIIYFERGDSAFKEALAWIPQSTVALVIAKAQHQVMERLKEVDVLIQVHDSFVGEYATAREGVVLPRLRELTRIEIPYADPLVIPLGLKTSTKSWGECEGRAWNGTR